MKFPNCGYFLDFKLEPGDLHVVRQYVRQRWLARIRGAFGADRVRHFEPLEMDRYHEFSYLIDHKLTFSNPFRILAESDVARLKQLPPFHRFKRLADEGKRGYENMLWRVVRPGGDDITPMHSDKDFGNVIGPCYNVWIALYAELFNGLQIVPKDDTELVKLPLAAGEGVIFEHDLLHGGVVNNTDRTRVSLEFTVML